MYLIRDRSGRPTASINEELALSIMKLRKGKNERHEDKIGHETNCFVLDEDIEITVDGFMANAKIYVWKGFSVGESITH